MINKLIRFKTYIKALIVIFIFSLIALYNISAVSGEDKDDFERNTFSLLKQTTKDIKMKSDGCMSCHTEVDSPSMHSSKAVRLGCTDCHGGKSDVFTQQDVDQDSPLYIEAMEKAHVLPKNKSVWKTSANPKQSYTALLKESPEFVKFVNPGDLRVVEETCGGCHLEQILNVRKSTMTTSAVFWAAAAYNNGIIAQKNAFLGEGYDREGKPVTLKTLPPPTEEEILNKGVRPELYPLPRWEIVKPGDNFRVFEDGGLFNNSLFPDIGNPIPFIEGGKPDIRQSLRGLGTGLRISVPILNLHKTRLNDPHLSFLGTNDQPGDYRSSGCSSCHVIYANDRDVFNSGPYAKFGNLGKSQSIDPTISKSESGHPIKHEFTNAIPSSQCIVCHMHQPNVFVNTFLGYTMWDYEADGEFMWPIKQINPTDDEKWEIYKRNPEGASARGLWKDVNFVANVSELNTKLKHTQFADYHGHGWNFRAVFKRDQKGNFLDSLDNVIPFDDITSEKLNRAIKETTDNPHERLGIPVHLKDIHLEKGMHCIDCHYEQDNHGNGKLHGEFENAIEIGCKDCHGNIKQKATLLTSGIAAPEGGNDLSKLRTPSGAKRFELKNGDLYQNSMVNPGMVWKVIQVVDTINPDSKDYNEKSSYAKTIRVDGNTWGNMPPPGHEKYLAHNDDNMECYTCHTSWTTACAGCHLPIEANWKFKAKHFEGKETRNFATYNPQAIRTDQFILGIHGSTKGNKIVPIRSSSALVLSSTNINRERIYIQQPPISSAGFSSQAFSPHFPHTVRSTETKTCTSCHISEQEDNNSWMQSLLGQGTNFVNFIGRYAWVATGKGGIEAIAVTEWDEPQAVFGSYLHKLAYPSNFSKHNNNHKELVESYHHTGKNILDVQLRGEYLYTASGEGGFRVYDVANIDNKGFSERIVTAPVSPLGQRTFVKSRYATSVGLPTTMPVDPTRCYREERGGKPFKINEKLPTEICRPENQEQRMHEIYRYVFITDKFEGLIVVNVDTLADRDPKNNFFKRSATYNPNNILTGANNIEIAGNYAYITSEKGLIIVDIEEPTEPKVAATVTSPYILNAKAISIQFRYAFVVDNEGMKVLDITNPEKPKPLNKASISMSGANDIYVARTFAYIAGGAEGLIIVDIEKPEEPFIYKIYNADGIINDTRGVKIGITNASLFAYLADGKNGLKVVQLTSPETTPGFYGFSPSPEPQLVASYHTHKPALSISKGLDRDRAVDESGNQVSIFSRIGSRPLNLIEMQKLYLKNGEIYKVSDSPLSKPFSINKTN